MRVLLVVAGLLCIYDLWVDVALLDKSANSARSRVADLQALQDRIANSFPKGHPTEESDSQPTHSHFPLSLWTDVWTGSASDMSMSDGDGNTDIASDDTGELLRELNRRDHSTVSQLANQTQNTIPLRSVNFGGHMRTSSGQ